MNKSYAGLVYTSSQLYKEIGLRIGDMADSQSMVIYDTMGALIKAILSIGQSINMGDEIAMVYYPDRNHTSWVDLERVPEHIQSLIGELLQHVCVIGEITANILGAMYGYAGLLDVEKEIPQETLSIAREIESFL